MPKVIIWRDGAIETEFDPGHRDWRMGRSETNDITLLDPRKSVSRFHAELREENGRWVFIDLNSQNGSWKDGQRVNRLVLEHGNEVLFGDYKLTFEDIKVPPPPPVPIAAADVTADVGAAATADVPLAPDQTLLMPGKAPAASASAPPSASAPVVRPAAKAKPPRKGVNPVILVLFLIAMLGAAAAVAWKLLSDRTVEPRVVEETQAEAEPESPVPPPVETPPVTTPTPEVTPPVTTPRTPETTSPPTTSTPPATTTGPVTTPPVTTTPPVAPPPTTQPGGKAATPGGLGKSKQRQPPAPPKDAPAVVARYEDGRRALAAGRFTEAERAFQAVLAQQPGYRDAAALLEEARQGQAAARQKALADAKNLEASGEWSRAVAAYERAGAAEEAAAARTKMTAAGDDAYRKARQFDARNRPTEAITWYQRAIEWLPDSDARKATAQERLATLKGGGE